MKTTNKKIIFLDFDGVMDTGYQEATKSLVSDKYGHIFDNECVVNLKKIIDYTKAGIVVSSTWKENLSLDDLIEMWESRKLPGRIMGATPNCRGERGFEIQQWLRNHNAELTKYAILDDLPADFFLPNLLPHLFIINPYTGLDSEIAERVINHLKD